jgi:CMP-2-keto-3-deoxyoctulosonic acid synthetase
VTKGKATINQEVEEVAEKIETTREKIVINQDAEEIAEKNDTIFFKAKRALTEDEHNLLSDRIRFETEKTGLKIILVPFSVDVEVDGESL